ncbi:MAG: hypothetical protein JXR73_13600, partial [Candidatus Omnitrophica bacterium]|nr:hypothetical protein [Candidatus Omnitrophota bacterium]
GLKGFVKGEITLSLIFFDSLYFRSVTCYFPSKPTTQKCIASLMLVFLEAVLCVSSLAYEISAESKKIVDAALAPGEIMMDLTPGNFNPDSLIPPGAIPLDAIDYLIDRLFAEDPNVNRSFIVPMIINIYDSNRERLKTYGLDDSLILFVESMESKKQYDEIYYSNISDCLRLLGKIRSGEAVQFIRSRTDLHYWDDKSVTVYDSKKSRIDMNNDLYRKMQREKSIHALCMILDATAEKFINDFEVDENDPDYRNLSPTNSMNKFLLNLHKLRTKHTDVLGEKYNKVCDDFYRLHFSIYVYYTGRKEFPAKLEDLPRPDELPDDVFRPDQFYSYQKTGSGYKLWSVGPNGKTGDAGSPDIDDIIIQYP